MHTHTATTTGDLAVLGMHCNTPGDFLQGRWLHTCKSQRPRQSRLTEESLELTKFIESGPFEKLFPLSLWSDALVEWVTKCLLGTKALAFKRAMQFAILSQSHCVPGVDHCSAWFLTSGLHCEGSWKDTLRMHVESMYEGGL